MSEGQSKASPHKTATRKSEGRARGIDYIWMTGASEEREKQGTQEHADTSGCWPIVRIDGNVCSCGEGGALVRDEGVGGVH